MTRRIGTGRLRGLIGAAALPAALLWLGIGPSRGQDAPNPPRRAEPELIEEENAEVDRPDADVAALGPSRYDAPIRDAVDGAAPHDAAAAKLLRAAESLLERGNHERARETLLFTLDRFGGRLVRLRGGRLGRVEDEANRLLSEMPPDALALYRRQFGGAADRLLEVARRDGDRAALRRVAVQFRHTAAAEEALRRLAAMHYDRGEFGLAAHYLRELPYFERSAGPKPAAGLRALAAATFAATGDRTRAAALLETLTPAERTTALPPGYDVAREIAATAARSGTLRPVDDWPLPFGDAAGSAVAHDGDPLLMRRWFRPAAGRRTIAERVERASADLRDRDLAPIPAAMPLTIEGKVVVRTLRGASVIDGASGRLLWETAEGNSPERRLAGLSPESDPGAAERQAVVRARAAQFGGDPFGAYGPNVLENLLFRDGVYGFLTADPRRLYLIEDHVELVRPVTRHPTDDADKSREGDLSANRVAAYDLRSGRRLWAAPPPTAADERLAGVYFFGPPTPSGDELYAVGERDKEIRLYALDPATGALKWERLLALAQVGIAQDPVRRWWPATPSVAGGVVVCPTTSGWLLGIDQAGHGVLWAYRYAPPQPEGNRDDGNGRPQVPLAELDRRWLPAAPTIRGDRILFTPPEEARLVCLDLYTGQLRWQHGKANALYLAGATEDAAVTVGAAGVTAFDLADGGTRWTTPLGPTDGPVSGRAAMTADRLFLPLRGDTLWTVDLAEGDVTERRSLPPGPGTLGNLLLHRGTLVSQGPDGVTAFEERGGLVAGLDAALKTDPADPDALLKRAALLEAEGDLAGASAAVGRIDLAALSGERQRAARDRKLDLLLRRAGVSDGDDALKELAAVAQTPDERFKVRQIEAARALEAGDHTAALAVYLGLIDAGTAGRTVSDDGGRTTVRLDAWLQARLKELDDVGGDVLRKAISDAVAARLDAAAGPARGRLAEQFAFHPAAAETLRNLAAAEAAHGDFFHAELRLLRLAEAGDAANAAAALLDLASLTADAGLPRDADALLDRIASRHPDALLPDGLPVADELASRRTVADAAPTPTTWGDVAFETFRFGGYYNAPQQFELRPSGADLPYFRTRLMRLAESEGRLNVFGSGGTPLERSLVLRTDGPSSGRRSHAAAVGHQLILAHGGVLQAVSPIDGRVVWAGPPAPEGQSGSRVAGPTELRTAGVFAARFGLLALARQAGPMAAANADHVALFDRRTLTVLDAATGEIRWTRADVPRGTQVVGTSGTLYLLPPDGGPTLALGAGDGRTLTRPGVQSRLSKAVAVEGDRLLTLSAEQTFNLFGFRGGKAVVTLYDPAADAVVWAREFDVDALFGWTGDGRLAVLTNDGKFDAIRPATGDAVPLGRLPAGVAAKQAVVLTQDADTLFMIVNDGDRNGAYFSTEVASAAVDGELFAFDAATAETLWTREVRGQRLFDAEQAASPVLLFMNNRTLEDRPNRLWAVDLLALDKRTGEPRLDAPFYSSYPPHVRGVRIDAESKFIELSSYNTRVRLQAVPKPAAEPEAETK